MTQDISLLDTPTLDGRTHSSLELERLELIRRLSEQSYIFATDPKTAQQTASQATGTPTDKLMIFADELDSTGELTYALTHANARFNWLGMAWSVVCFVLAIIATYGLMSSQIINFFYIFIALLGWHTVTLVIWLVRDKNSVLFSFIGQTLEKISPNFDNHPDSLATTVHRTDDPLTDTARAVIAQKNAPIRHWQFAKLIHQGWLATLFGNILALFILFLSKNYLFVWESTLLTQASIAKLIHAIALPLTAFGLHLPAQGELMTGNYPAKSLAIILLTSLVVYGVVPRALAFLWAFLAIKRHKFALNSNAYFFENLLRQFNQKITNPNDYQAPPPRQTSVKPTQGKHIIASLEVAPNKDDWYKAFLDNAEHLGVGTLNSKLDFAYLHNTLNDERLPVLLGIGTHLVPDRGLVKKVQWVAGVAIYGFSVALLGNDTHRAEWERVLGENGVSVVK